MAESNIDKSLLGKIRSVLLEARTRVYSMVNTAMVQSYWHIGKPVVDAQRGESSQIWRRTSQKHLRVYNYIPF